MTDGAPPGAAFRDHFSGVADAYAAFRPTQPASLVAWAAELAGGHALAWDCATGNGQAAVAVAEHFAHVVATDASEAQLAHATPHARVAYRRATAEASGLAPASVDLVTVAQALHWFDLDAFYREARRVLAPGGALVAWCYMAPRVEAPDVDALFDRFAHGTLGPYWPPERRLIDEGYRTIPFPFDEVAAPLVEMALPWTLPQLAGYMRSWSSTVRYAAAHRGRDPVADFEVEARATWPAGGSAPLVVRWPYAVRAGRI